MIDSYYTKKWGKYRIGMDGYAYTVDGKIVGFVGSDKYHEWRRVNGTRIDKLVEQELGIKPKIEPENKVDIINP